MTDVEALEREINSAFGTDAVHRLVADKVVESRWLKEREADAWLAGAHYAWSRAEAKVSAWAMPMRLAEHLPRHVRFKNPFRDERKRKK